MLFKIECTLEKTHLNFITFLLENHFCVTMIYFPCVSQVGYDNKVYVLKRSHITFCTENIVDIIFCNFNTIKFLWDNIYAVIAQW
jgi:hypothetical protein